MYFYRRTSQSVTNLRQPQRRAFRAGSPFQPQRPGNLSTELLFAWIPAAIRKPTTTSHWSCPAPGSLGICLGQRPLVRHSIIPARPCPSGREPAPISFQVAPSPTAVNAQIDIFQGVVGWVTVSNVPSSPTASASASLTVGGQNVDYYEYQLNRMPGARNSRSLRL